MKPTPDSGVSGRHDYRRPDRTIPASIRRRYGYPAPYRGPVDDLAERLERIEREWLAHLAAGTAA